MARFKARKAVREKIYAKIGIAGTAGSGKTYGALLMATGMAEEIEKQTGTKGKILMANTEGSRGLYYAGSDFQYDIIDLDAPFNPELFIDAINYAIEEKYDILIIDSASHEWEGKGGCLELQSKAGGTFQAWSKITPRHQAFMEKIVTSPLHIISCIRSKSQYEIDKDEKGKASVKKVGLAGKQREGFDFEQTVYLTLDAKTHTATCEKDNTKLFNDNDFIITTKTGEDIIKWANSSDIEPVTPSTPTTQEADLDTIKSEIISKATTLMKSNKEQVIEALKIAPDSNPNKLADAETANKLLAALDAIN